MFKQTFYAHTNMYTKGLFYFAGKQVIILSLEVVTNSGGGE